MGSNLVDVPDSARCTATANRSGQRCRRAAIPGGKVCRSHGGAAPAVRRAAAERVALQRAVGLIGDTTTPADPKRVLVAAVNAANAFLGGAVAALEAPDADQACLRQLGEAALLAGKLSKLALDAHVEERVAATYAQHGELVAGLLRRVVGRVGLAQTQETALYASLAVELRALDGYDPEAGRPAGMFEADARAATVEAELAHRVLDQVEAELPERLAAALAIGLAAVHLTAQDRERVARAVERHLAREAQLAAAEPLTHAQVQHRANTWRRASNGGVRSP